MGVLGPWGSGKTSLINLVREKLAAEPAVPVIDFNPWMFSGAEQLLESFFREIAAQLQVKDKKFKKIADSLGTYSALLAPLAPIPVIGAWAERTKGAGEALQRFADARQESVHERRHKLETLLAKLDTPIVVVIDDIDRLSTAEIREIFKLVRLTASFPNIIYVLAFDRGRVEAALQEDRLSGRDYLEKIIQSAVDIPKVPDQLLITTFGTLVQESIDSTGAATRFDDTRWPDVLAEVVWPLIDSMRDVRRYASSIDAAVRELQDEVELVDLLALEAIRVFMPDTFAAIYELAPLLTSVRSGFGMQDDPTGKGRMEAFLEVAAHDGYREVGRALIERVFPGGVRHIGGTSYMSDFAQTWLRQRRVANVEILRRYLERISGEGMTSFLRAEQLFSVLGDRERLEAAISDIKSEDLEDSIAALEIYQDAYPVEAVLPAIIVLLNVMPRIPDRERGMWAFVDGRMVVDRVVLRMLRRLPNPEEVQRVVDQAMPELTSFSAKYELVTLVGYQKGAGQKMIDAGRASELETNLGTEIANASAETLAQEVELLRLLYAARKFGAPITAMVTEVEEPALTASILKSALTESRSQPMGSRAIRREARLQWQVLIELYGSEEALQTARERVRVLAIDDSVLGGALGLADRYLSGWRPRQFMDDEEDD
jgi:hypothetical protein